MSSRSKQPVQEIETFSIDATLLLSRLSFTHFAELLRLDDPTQRAFLEAEAIRGHWSVRELKRQIASLYFERSGLSRNGAANNICCSNRLRRRAKAGR